MKNRICVIVVMSLMFTWRASAQEYSGTTGMLSVPTAETEFSGTFRGGISFLNDHITPDKMVCDGEKYNTGGYFVSITPWSWIEMAYACTLLKYHKNRNPEEPVGYYNEDRRVGVKLRPLKEGRWWPALAVGVDDAQQFVEKLFKSHKGSTNYQNVYIVASKHFDLKGNELAAHVGYRYFIKEQNSNRRGVVGGLTYVPRLSESLQNERAWLQRPRLMAEWDGKCVNVGVDMLLWRHLYAQVGLTNGKYFVGGVGYHYRIKY